MDMPKRSPPKKQTRSRVATKAFSKVHAKIAANKRGRGDGKKDNNTSKMLRLRDNAVVHYIPLAAYVKPCHCYFFFYY